MSRVSRSVLLCIGSILAMPIGAAEDHSTHQTPSAAQTPAEQSDPVDHSAHTGEDVPPDHSTHGQHSEDRARESHPDAHGAHGAERSQLTESERAHVPPDPARNPLEDMSEERMIELMQMEDDAAHSRIIVDQLEWRRTDADDVTAWEFDAWYGTDYNKLWFETEGERTSSEEAGRVELMWDHIVSPWWSFQTGIRQDFGEGSSRTWADFGFQGLAPYFFEVDAALYIGEEGRTAARFSAEYDLLLTQRLILQPELEFELYGKDDPDNGIGSGFSDMEVGLRLRYEIRREIAPYIGAHWDRKFGRTADLAQEAGKEVSELIVIAGIRAWF